jgi:hypothetical protein
MRRIWSRLVNLLNLHRSGAAPVVDGALLAEIDLARPSTFAARKSSTESADSPLQTTAVARTAVIQAKRGIGDVVWHLPFVRAIASVSPGGQVTFMAPPSSRAKDLLAAEPSVLQTIYFEHAGSELRRGVNLVRLARLLRRGRFRTVWILDRTLRPAIAAMLARIPERIGLGLGRQSLFITNSGIGQSHFHDHPIDWLRALMAEMKVPLPSTEPALNVPKNILAAVDARFHICPRPWIVLGLGASHPNREWPQEHWVDLLPSCALTVRYSLLWLTAIQIVEGKQNLPGLPPKSGFIATEAVESEIRQITEPQETTCELNVRSNLTLGWGQRARLCCVRGTVRHSLPIRVCIEERICDLTRGRGDLVRLSKVSEMVRLDFEKTRFDARCPS